MKPKRNENRRAMAVRNAQRNSLPHFERIAYAANDRPDKELFWIALGAGAVIGLAYYGAMALPTVQYILSLANG